MKAQALRSLIVVLALGLLAPASPVQAKSKCENLWVAAESKAAVSVNRAQDLTGRHFELTKNFYKSRDEYDSIFAKLKSGDLLDFGDGHVFVVKKLLGAGATTYVIETREGDVLRVPKAGLYTAEGGDGYPILEKFVSGFAEAYRELRANGVPVVEVDLERSVVPRFLIVKKVDIQFRLDELIEKRTEDGKKLKVDKAERKKAWAALLDFARTTWMYRRIGDFRPDQLVYNGKRWVLIDFLDSHERLTQFEDKNTFSPITGLDELSRLTTTDVVPEEHFIKIREVIDAERRVQKAAARWFERERSLRKSHYLITDLTRQESLLGARLRAAEGFDPVGRPKGFIEFTVVREVERKKNSVFFEIEIEGGKRGLLELLVFAREEDPRSMYEVNKFTLDRYEARARNLRLCAEGTDYHIFQEQ